MGGRRQSKSFSDLRLLGNAHSQSRGWAWDTEHDDDRDQVEQPPATTQQVQDQEHEQEQEQNQQQQQTQLQPDELNAVTTKQEDEVEKEHRAALEMMPPEILGMAPPK